MRDNKTNHYINVESFSVYADSLVDTAEKIGLSLPPLSEKTVDFSRKMDVLKGVSFKDVWLYLPRYKFYADADEKLTFGVALSYFNVDTNKRNTLLLRETYSRSDFEPYL